MLDPKFIRENIDRVKENLKKRNLDPKLAGQWSDLDQKRREITVKIENLRAKRNQLTEQIKKSPNDPALLKEAKKVKQDLQGFETPLPDLESAWQDLLHRLPNIAADDVPIGKDDTGNVVIKTVGDLPKFDFKPLDHLDLGEKLNLIDVKKAGQLSGSRFGYFKNKAALLEMALMFHAFKKLVDKGFHGMIPPAMVKSRTEWACGYADNNNLFNAYYSIPEDDLIFISSSEHSVVPYHSGEALDPNDLPLKYVNFSPCFRRESGTYGKDTRGLFRVHFFNKVEMNIFSLPDYQISDKLCLEMLQNEEELVQELGLPYQIKNCCTGDLPQPNRRMYDLEVWFPGQNAYRETHSCSNCGDYQARRLDTKTDFKGKKEFVHILNATMATDRLVLAILENFQQKDGLIAIPKVLQPLVGKEIIKS